jgi:GntR family transcriptional repressor for pyruvate dehydrogenase complex
MLGDSLTVRVTDYIFNYIRDNELPTGHPLPSEGRTSSELNISRGTVREAFSSLEVAGIINKGNGRFPKVGELNGAFLTHLMSHAISTRQVSVSQILELRCPIEVLSAELAARRRTRSEVVRLRATVACMKEAIWTPAEFVQHDLDFHSLINRASGNPLVEMISEAMLEATQTSMIVGLSKCQSVSDLVNVVHTHELIANAIEQGDARQAGILMKKHFDQTQAVISQMSFAGASYRTSS